MKRWYSFYADKFQDEKLVRCVQELYDSGNLAITSGVIPFPEMFGLIPWGHHLDVVRLSNTLPEAVFFEKNRRIGNYLELDGYSDCLKIG